MHNTTDFAIVCFIRFYSLLFVLRRRARCFIQISSAVSFCIFLSTITWLVSVSVPCVLPSVYAEATIPTETYRQPAGGIVLCLTELACLLFLSFFPFPLPYFGGGRSSLRPATRFTNKSRDRRNSNKKNNKSHSCSSSHGEHFPLGSV